MTLSEREFISRIRNKGVLDSNRLILGIGDDCAVYRHNSTDSKLDLITTDALVESVHFDLSWHPPKYLGRKSLSVNISDIAGMGGQPLFALLSLGIPKHFQSNLLDEFMTGFDEVVRENNIVLIGGDTVKSSGFFISVTVIGEVDEKNILYRSGARSGDSVWVSGNLGQAAAGLEICKKGLSDERFASLINSHLDPKACVSLGRALAVSGLVNSMMDVSDGVATDLAHICEESGVGAELDASSLPISDDLKFAAKHLNCSEVDWALTGGEDYQLLFTAPAANDYQLSTFADSKGQNNLYRIGSIIDGEGVRLLRDGQMLDISYNGFDHFC